MGFIAFFLAMAVGSAGVPASDWRPPTPTEADQDWRSESPHRYLVVKADLDGDSVLDEAALLVNTDGASAAIVVRLGRGGDPYVLVEFEVWWLDSMGIDVVRPGSYATACGKGYWECGPDETENLQLQWPAINFFKVESANSFYFYDPITKAFRTMQISD